MKILAIHERISNMSHKIYALIGPSGSGKTTIANELFTKQQQIVSFTSRDPRPGEIEGVDYYFIGRKTPDEIHQLEQDWRDGILIEVIEYNNHVYGYTTKEVAQKFNPETTSVVTVVTKEGYDHLMLSSFKNDIVPVYVSVTRDTVKKHLLDRDDTPENIEKRLALYDAEIKQRDWFDTLDEPKILLHNNSDTIATVVEQFRQAMSKIEKDDKTV